MIVETRRSEAVRALDRDGYVVFPGALSSDLVADLRDAVDRIWWLHRDVPPEPGVPAVHLLAFLREDPVFLTLLDQPGILDLIVNVLGPNIFMYHCHLDVHPPEVRTSSTWMWHQDGGIQNRDLETEPRPRLSLKVAYFLSDASQPDRGNFMVVPGSHVRNHLERPPDRVEVAGARPVLAAAGDAVVFDRRLWHRRGANRSSVTREALFYAYTYRWVRPRDDLELPAALVATLSPVRRQLVGDGEPALHHWMPDRVELPVRDAVVGTEPAG